MDTTYQLPITEYLPQILIMIEENLVTQVTAATGSGKSIYVLKALAESGKRVFSSVPTRVSATSLCSYLKTLNRKLKVGHAAEGNVMYNKSTQVVYATSGHVRRKMLNYFSQGLSRWSGLSFTDILVLDETHSGSMDNTVILSLWMEALRKGFKVPKLLLLSATPTDLPIDPAPVICTVPIPTPFPVDIVYDPPDSDDEIYNHALDIIVEMHYSNRVLGDFLVFVPGSREVDELVEKIKEQIPEVLVFPAYSTLDSDELKLIYTPTGDTRKIVVATNIAESSITIDGVGLVIDTLRCKEATASSSGATRLETVLITKDSAKQRLGRTGRTRPGVCYRLISESDYDNLQDHRQPEIERMPIHNVVMEFLQANIDPIKTIRGINEFRVIESVELLTRLGMLEIKNDKHVVTDSGHFAPSVPLGVKNAAFLWKWIKAGYPIYPGVVIACVIDVHATGYFYIPRKKQNQSSLEYIMFCTNYIQHNFKSWIGDTPIHTYLNMWTSFTTKMGRNHYRLITDPFSCNYRKWSRQHSMNYKQLSELVLITSQTYRIARSTFKRSDPNVFVFDVNQHFTNAVPILQSIYERDKIISRFGIMIHPLSGLAHNYDLRRVISHIEVRQSPQVLALATHEIVCRNGIIIGYIDLCIPSPQSISEFDSDSDSD